jgi:hypothetical protein
MNRLNRNYRFPISIQMCFFETIVSKPGEQMGGGA